MRISDWSSDVCSSDLRATVGRSIDARYGEPLHVESILDAFRLPDVFELVEQREGSARPGVALAPVGADRVERTEFELSVTSRELHVAHEVLVLGEIGRASGRERVCKTVYLSGV